MRRSIKTNELVDLFLSKGDFHKRGLTWIDDEVREILQIDVCEQPFAIDAGCQVYESEKARLLLIRTEDLYRVSGVVAEFLNLPRFKLMKENVGEKKEYGKVYRQFKEAIRLPVSYIQTVHGHHFCKHFYTTSELESVSRQFRERGKSDDICGSAKTRL